jgi:hypothetical protein
MRRRAVVGGGELGRAFDRFSVGEVGVVALERKAVVVYVNDFTGVRQSGESTDGGKAGEENLRGLR